MQAQSLCEKLEETIAESVAAREHFEIGEVHAPVVVVHVFSGCQTCGHRAFSSVDEKFTHAPACVGDLEDVRVRLQALPDASDGFVYELRVSVQKASDERFIGVGRPFAHSGQQSVRNIAVRSGPEMATLETVAFCVAHVAPQSAREEHLSVFLPFETAFEGRVPRLLQNRVERREVIVEHEVVGVADAGESDEEHAGLFHGFAEFDDRGRERHTLRFPRRESPAEDEGKLRAAHGAMAVVVAGSRENGHPRRALGVCEKGWALIFRTVNDNAGRHTTCDVIVVWVRTGCKNNGLDNALSAVHEAVLHFQIVNDNNASLFGELEAFCEAIEDGVIELCALRLGNAFVHCVDSDDWRLVFARQGPQFHAIFILAVVLRVRVRLASEVHEHGRSLEASSVAQRALRAFQVAQPIVVFDREREVADAVEKCEKAVRALIVSVVCLCCGLLDLVQAMRGLEHDDVVEFAVDLAALVREAHRLRVRI